MMLLAPSGLQSIAEGSVLYSELGTSTWGHPSRDIEYGYWDGSYRGDGNFIPGYDDNGSLTKKVTWDQNGTPTTLSDDIKLEEVRYEYNLQNRLKRVETDYQDGTVEIAEYKYNPDGARVSKHTWTEISGIAQNDDVTTIYLVDSYNHTGYAQTLEELTFNKADPDPLTETPDSLRTYVIGDDVIAQTTDGTTEYLLYDGHGSTRQLAEYDGSVTITDSFSYDSYGVMLQDDSVASANPGYTPAQATNLLYSGEMWDSQLEHYYLRARWYDSVVGRFNRTDPFAGNNQDPQSLHKYTYVHNNPINATDPTGRYFSSPYHGWRVEQEIFHHFRVAAPLNDRLTNRRINTILGTKVKWWGWDRPDLVDRTTGEVWEIKPLGAYAIGRGQLLWYLYLLNTNDPLKRVWRPGMSYVPPSTVPIDPMSFAFVFPPKNGIIEYEVFDVRPTIALVVAYNLAQLRAHMAMVQLRGALCRVPF